MAMQPLTHENIGLLDQGRAGAVIDAAIRQAVIDLEDRGADGKPREVTIKLRLVQTGEDRFAAEVEAGVKVPGYRTSLHAGDIRRKEGEKKFMFQEFDQDDPDQRRIEDLDQRHEQE